MMEFDRGDVVHYHKRIAIVIQIDRKNRRYLLELEQGVSEWVDAKEVR